MRQKAGLGINLQVTDVECNCNLEIVTDVESICKPRKLRMAMKLNLEKFGKKTENGKLAPPQNGKKTQRPPSRPINDKNMKTM